MGWVWFFGFFGAFLTLAYQRASLHVWTLSFAILLVLLTKLSHASIFSLFIAWVAFIAIAVSLYATTLRKKYFTQRVLTLYRKIMPTMSTTEREALAAGTIGWEGELFRGIPNWKTLFAFKKPHLTDEEQAYLDGPVDTLCSMIDDWDITHNRCDLPPEMWQYLKDNGFFGLIIPKEYGGKEFSAYAHSQIIMKVYGISATVATTLSVPNSLGPAELLLHYGTPEQKKYYLPRLARGEEIPCFALTGPEAGSDAGAMTDTGIVCWGDYQGQRVLGIRLNWNKRYITLAPVATLIGLAFKLYDPDHLLGTTDELGITCALIPRETEGVVAGRRHFPCNIAFHNGPTQGHNVFIPLDWIIGGQAMVGQGWRMLMECLAAGRAISLPGSAIGGAKSLSYASGAYARVRRQFNVSIGRFEGIEEVLARIGGLTYLMDATRTFTAGMIDLGEKPAVASAITKYHVTEFGRMTANDGMDLHGGKGICLGPKNYLGRQYQGIPIAITVEGANILTRNLIIFGQGAMRCHPYIFAEFEAASIKNDEKSLNDFDRALMGHMGYTLSNCVQTLVLSLTCGKIARVPAMPIKKYIQSATRLSAAFAMVADLSLLTLGGSLKRKENISARLGDILSYLYMLSAVFKHYQDQGQQADDLPLVRWACLYCLYQIQERFDELLKNFPNRWLAGLLRVIIFPYGKHFTKPSDKLSHKITQLLMAPTSARYRLTEGAYTTASPGNVLADLEDALIKVVAAEPVEKTIKTALQNGLIKDDTIINQATEAHDKKLITREELDSIIQAEEARSKVIAVDDFAPEELTHGYMKQQSSERHATTTAHYKE